MKQSLEAVQAETIKILTPFVAKACADTGKKRNPFNQFKDPVMAQTSKCETKHACGFYILKWLEDFNGVFEEKTYLDERVEDFKKWLLADFIVDLRNEHYHQLVRQIGYLI